MYSAKGVYSSGASVIHAVRVQSSCDKCDTFLSNSPHLSSQMLCGRVGERVYCASLHTLEPCSNIRNAELCFDSCSLLMLNMLNTLECSKIERLVLCHTDLWDSSDSSSESSDSSKEDELELLSILQNDSNSENDGMQELDTSQYEPIVFLRLKTFLSQCTRLKMLSIEQPQGGFKRKIVELLQAYSPQVQHFSLTDADYTDWAVTTAVLRFNYLKSIDVTGAGSLTDATLCEIATHCWQTLESLYTVRTEGLTNEGYRAVFDSCHRLRSFSFSDDSAVDVTLLNNLTSLLIHYPCDFNEPVSTSLVDIASHCSNLCQLNVTYDSAGNSDEVDFSVCDEHNLPRLTALRFSGPSNHSLKLLGEQRPRLNVVYGVARLNRPFADDMMTTQL